MTCNILQPSTIKVEFTEARLIRCTDRQTKETYYLARSSKNNGTYYFVTFSHGSARWQCTCPSYRQCSHVNVVNAALAQRRAAIAAKMGPQAQAVVKQLQAQDDVRQQMWTSAPQLPAGWQERSQLNGPRAFSLMR